MVFFGVHILKSVGVLCEIKTLLSSETDQKGPGVNQGRREEKVSSPFQEY